MDAPSQAFTSTLDIAEERRGNTAVQIIWQPTKAGKRRRALAMIRYPSLHRTPRCAHELLDGGVIEGQKGRPAQGSFGFLEHQVVSFDPKVLLAHVQIRARSSD